MSDDVTLSKLQLALQMAKIHFYRAYQLAANLKHEENRKQLSERLSALHDELNWIDNAAESRKAVGV